MPTESARKSRNSADHLPVKFESLPGPELKVPEKLEETYRRQDFLGKVKRLIQLGKCQPSVQSIIGPTRSPYHRRLSEIDHARNVDARIK
jgi:hypothetical protein